MSIKGIKDVERKVVEMKEFIRSIIIVLGFLVLLSVVCKGDVIQMATYSDKGNLFLATRDFLETDYQDYFLLDDDLHIFNGDLNLKDDALVYKIKKNGFECKGTVKENTAGRGFISELNFPEISPIIYHNDVIFKGNVVFNGKVEFNGLISNKLKLTYKYKKEHYPKELTNKLCNDNTLNFDGVLKTWIDLENQTLNVFVREVNLHGYFNNMPHLHKYKIYVFMPSINGFIWLETKDVEYKREQTIPEKFYIGTQEITF